MAPEAEASVSESTPTPSKPQDAVPTVLPKTTENPARKQPGPVVTAAATSEPESRTVSGAENRHPPKAQANPQATTIPPTKISRPPPKVRSNAPKATAAPKRKAAAEESSETTQCVHHVSKDFNQRCVRRVKNDEVAKVGYAICHNHKKGFSERSTQQQQEILGRDWPAEVHQNKRQKTEAQEEEAQMEEPQVEEDAAEMIQPAQHAQAEDGPMGEVENTE
jgi:hypothetical protein